MSMTPQDNLRGQRALVTGATSGIGRAVALQLARDGAEVLVHGRDAGRGAQTVQEITAGGGNASFVAADLGEPAGAQRLADDVGEVDILINNAGMARWAPTAEFDGAAFDKMFTSNVRAPFFLVAALAPGMAARGHGSIVSVSSVAGGVGLVGGAAYGATKASLEAGETTPMHRASQPEEIAEVIAFLASPRASYITGTTVAADCGRSAI
jgi:NAD(P)-dependent dehydrogenase (short-subunit alcohol dehydrogenase family)